MVKKSHGKNKQQAAMQRRLDRSAAKARRKSMRHPGMCGAIDRRPHGDGSHVCMVCMAELTQWFDSETIYPDTYDYVE